MNFVKAAGILGIAIVLTADMLIYCSPYESCVRALSENPTAKNPEIICLRMVRRGG